MVAMIWEARLDAHNAIYACSDLSDLLFHVEQMLEEEERLWGERGRMTLRRVPNVRPDGAHDWNDTGCNDCNALLANAPVGPCAYRA